MKHSKLLSALLCGLSTFLLAAQPRTPTHVSLDVEVGRGAAKQTSTATEAGTKEPEAKPDINEIVRTTTVFTNSVGLVLKKVGDLWVSASETTQDAYQEVTGANPSVFTGKKRPVDSVSWNDATDFCDKLTAHEKDKDMLPDGYRYALPTQAQWDSLAAGIPLADAVTSSASSRSGTAEVGSLPATAGGLFDLRGNVAEWSADPTDGPFRVLRGGTWEDWIEINLRPEFRIYAPPNEAKNTYGFRCVLIQRK
ncbi:MAG: formylglycine-generating enzyme family protein [Verrucomicrobia bacterium]|jgi:formylglycine-generating enzyme required for sulfatase activity|nr:formylglycine-generating enzyme family protein [Verrucomicrobiota bacterium]